MNTPNEILIQKKQNLTNLLEENKKVSSFISNLNKNIIKDVFVPIMDKLAFLPGKIINTNECNVYLGEDIFVHTTNHIAIKILEDRAKKLDSLISDLNKQINPCNKEEKLPNNLKKLDDDTIEIIENYEDNSKQSIISRNENLDLKIIQKLESLSKPNKSEILKEKIFQIEETIELMSINKIQTDQSNVQNNDQILLLKRSHFYEEEEFQN